ncbi:MAG: hypothetical protein ACRD50_09910 [Candidatus Acidiferrales bacterium]
MNRAYLIIGIPAFVVSFFWMLLGWGLRVALPITLGELALALAAIFYVRRREQSPARKQNS